jgi:hypothetical protein
MGGELKLLNQQLDLKPQSKVAKELKVSPATLSLVLKGRYPNPTNIYKKINDKYGSYVEIVGVGTCKSAKEIFDELMEMGA